MEIAIAIIAILVVAAATLVLTTSRRRSTTGRLSRETRGADTGAGAPSAAGDEFEAAGKERAEETRALVASGAPGAPATTTGGEVALYEPVDEEELGVTRRQFLNRGVGTAVGFGVAAFGAGALAFIWPVSSGGFGGKVDAGRLDQILADIAEKKQPFYVPEARAYAQAYPTEDVENAASAGYPEAVVPGLEAGVMALYQKCPHLGCRVPWCQSSQWFECPCHGSKYNAVGEKRDGPAPRGMSLFRVEVGDELIIDTGVEFPGLPIGTDTTGQRPEGPSCI